MRGPFSLIAAYPKRAGAILYTVIIMIPSTWIYLSNPHPWPVLMADHPEITLSQIPRWYGPGAWAAVLATVMSMFFTATTDKMLSLLNVLAFATYSLLSSWDLHMKAQALVDSQGYVDYTILAPCAAANKAVSFCSGVLQVYAVYSWFETRSKPCRLANAKLVSILIISLIPIVFIWPHKGGIRAWKCDDGDDKCTQAHLKVQSFVFFGQVFSEAMGELKDVAFSMYPIRIAGNLGQDIMLVIPGLMSLGVMNLFLWMSQLGWKRRLSTAVALGGFFFWISPLFILWIVPSIILFLLIYPLLCLLLYLPVITAAAISWSSVFPDSNISIMEADQLVLVLAALSLGMMSARERFVRGDSEKPNSEKAERLPRYAEGSKRPSIQVSTP
ncbi:hypothetical protein DL96DRAFT_1616830 [Flagelloscypha sp. PMI_526]|nr:hypothetical protein DL96DRAFT_1616830 [Flagelloscypha sp. PMI_526]